jgi:hypothetical protein
LRRHAPFQQTMPSRSGQRSGTERVIVTA